MKILITGGAGYIGTELVSYLNKIDDVEEIIVYDNLWKNNYNLFLNSGIKKGKVKFVKGELLDSRKLNQVLEGVDVVYHLAARVASRLVNASHHLYEQINNWGTAELVYAVEKHNVKTFIYTSSITVYGDMPETITHETIPNPKTYYGASKLRGEEHVNRLKDKINTYVLRVGNVYGYGVSMRFDTVINKFIFDAAFKNRIKILGNGTQHRSFIYIDSLVEILAELRNGNKKSDTFNVVEQSLSVNDLVDITKNLYPDIEMLFVNQHLRLRNIDVAIDERLVDKKNATEEKLMENLEIFKKHLELSSKNI